MILPRSCTGKVWAIAVRLPNFSTGLSDLQLRSSGLICFV